MNDLRKYPCAKENSIYSNILFNQLISLYKIRILLSVTIILCSMTYFEYYDPYSDEIPKMKYFLNATINLFCILSVAIYIYSIIAKINYFKFNNQILERVNPIKFYGIFKLLFFSLLLLISPIYDATEYYLFTKESYFNGQREYYGRRIYEYIIVITVTVHFLNAVNLTVLGSYWGSPKTMRISKMAGIEHNLLFIIKCILKQYPQFFSLGILLFLVLYYAIILRIIESGMQRSLRMADYTLLGDFEAD